MPPQWPAHELRASDADREAACDRLRTAALEGRLDPLELDERLGAAYGSRWCSELDALTADVTPPPAAPPAAPAPPVFVRPTPTNGLAVASLICGAVWLGWIGSALAIVFGHVALSQIARSGGRERGRGAAIAGLVLGYLGALTFLLTLALVAGFSG
jgi:Domain of unknown function (DUF4190)/Domain of unknown function (DUF1707)